MSEKINVYSLKREVKGKVQVPDVFNTEYRPDLIQKVVVSMQANKRQVYGCNERAGLQTTADYFGRRRGTYRQTINRGQSRLPREKPGGGGLGKVRKVPQSVGGRRAHPPKKKNWIKRINNKEYLYAMESAIAATNNVELLAKRGHIPSKLSLPLIIEDSFESLNKTKDVIDILTKLELSNDLERAKKKRVRSVLIITNEDGDITRASRNIPGVDIVRLDDLNVELLAPGTHAGRLTLWTQSAVEKLSGTKFENE